MSVEIECFHPVTLACLDLQNNSKREQKKTGRKYVSPCMHAGCAWVPSCHMFFRHFMKKMIDISSIVGLFLAPTVSNYNWCFHAFQFAAATCQYFLRPLKILIVIKRIKCVWGGGTGKFREAKQPIYQNRSVWKQDEFLYSLLKELFRTEDCGGDNAAENFFLTHTQLGRGSLKGREVYYCPPVFAIRTPPHTHTQTLVLTSTGSHSIWQSKCV